ncbi:CAF1-domain-containing protein [Myriangium duriaei CBS 260.36]|uniref:CAF1-domain-containing protein n=1 Tax=Myriangium duriaei CBS 260.36 TaxID=1168546 RepID=A0A9P4J1A0_9PEZI|nr:CAF1-domain-containing protein [Myriangium duriaei CBS 260.36]
MDIQRHNFPSKLLDILEAISESYFVAFDLELSGVPVRPYGAHRSGKATLQERYTETKAAAERYQILQIGLTCVKEDTADGAYQLKPFNIDLSPILGERLDIDRDFSFHSGAVEFLNSVGFDFNNSLTNGVSYLSRDEADLAKQRAEERLSRTNDTYDRLEVKPEETETLAFLQRVKEKVDAWLKLDQFDPEPLFLGSKELCSRDIKSEELSRFEKRLVHQTIRQDYPQLVTIPRRGVIQVSRLDEEREAAVRRSKLKDTKSRIYRQTGFRWVIEAIAGRTLKYIELDTFTTNEENGFTTPANFDIKARFQRCQHLLYKRPKPVVGHNLFLDLIYLYRTFIGQLPERVDDFAAQIHELFPIVVDTKYLATHECGDINPMSSLQQLAEQMDAQQSPLIATHYDYRKYLDNPADHEAGYDSMLTGQVAIRLSTMLEARKRTPTEANAIVEFRTGSDEDQTEGGVSLDRGSHSNGNNTGTTSMLAAATDALRKTVIVPVGKDDWYDGKTAKIEPASWSDAEQQWIPLRLMPRWSSDFWREYGNRLRVFSTQEGMCRLDAGLP